MGKCKRVKREKPKYRPIDRLQTQSASNSANVTCTRKYEIAHIDSSQVHLSNMSGTVSALTKKLQSTSPDERQCTCRILASLVSQPGAVQQIIEAGTVRVLGPLLIDQCIDVRLAALGALRNLSVDGGVTVCDVMVQQDVMTSLTALLQMPQLPSSDVHTDGVASDILLQAVSLLSNLCEASEVAVRIVNQQRLVSVLLQLLLGEQTVTPLKLAAAQCIYVLCDNNTEVTALLSGSDIQRHLVNAVCTTHTTYQQLLLRVQLAGVLCSGNMTDLVAMEMSVLDLVTPLLCEVLSCDVIGRLAAVATIISQLPSTSVAADSDDIGQISHKMLETSVDDVMDLICAQRLAVEIITNVFTTDDTDGDWEDCSETSSDDNTNNTVDDTANMECMEVSMSSDVPNSSLLSVLTPKLFQLVSVMDERTFNILTTLTTSPVCKKLVDTMLALHMTVLLCVSNIVEFTDLTVLGGPDSLHVLWGVLSCLTRTSQVVSDESLLEAVTSAMRAIVCKLGQIKTDKMLSVTECDVAVLAELCTKCVHPGVRVNMVRIACSLAVPTCPVSLLQSLAGFLLHVASTDVQLWVCAEALDAIFDVFSEDSTDDLARTLDVVGHLRRLSPTLTAKAHEQKKTLGEHRAIVSTVRANLPRFIAYKTSRFAITGHMTS